jgi:phenylacetate-CoA ligase
MKARLCAPDRDRLDPIERASRDEVAALQLDRLRWSIRHAYDNVAQYREKCRQMDIHPDHLTRLDDLRRFPFTVKDDLRQTYPFGMFACPMEQIVRIHASSGTTGRSTVVGYTRNDIDTWASLVARSLRAAGARPGHKVQVAYGYGLFTGGLGAHYGAERLGCAVIPISGGQTEKQVQLIVDLEPDLIMVTPSYMQVILDEMDRQGIVPERCSLKVGVFGAEPWTDRMRDQIERRLDCDAVDIYGLSEVMGPGVASECIESKDGPTLWEDHFLAEIIDPLTGMPQDDGQPGELVLTSLTKEALPIIRYRTRDLCSLLPPTARSFRRLGKITGRSDDMLIIRGVNVFPTQIEEQLLKNDSLSAHYQLEIDRVGPLDEMTVHVEMRTDVFLGEDDRQTIAAELRHHIKSCIGISTRVDIMEPNSLPRSLGKAKRVIDNRPKG